MYADIYTAIETEIATVIDPEAIQLPNTYIDVANRIYWVRVTHLPISPTVGSVGTTGQNVRGGLTQVDVFVKPGTGQPTQSDQIVALFARGSTLSLTDGVIYDILAYRDGGDLVEDGYWADRVLIRWSALTDF